MAEAVSSYAQGRQIRMPSTFARDYEAMRMAGSAHGVAAGGRSAGRSEAPGTGRDPEVVRRTRERPKKSAEEETHDQVRVFNYLTRAGLFRAVIAMLAAAAILVGIVWLGAVATDVKYSINRINKQNAVLRDEIDVLELKIESANTIERIEEYATGVLKMRYPDKGECIYVAEDTVVPANFSQIIRSMAYETPGGEAGR